MYYTPPQHDQHRYCEQARAQQWRLEGQAAALGQCPSDAIIITPLMGRGVPRVATDADLTARAGDPIDIPVPQRGPEVER